MSIPSPARAPQDIALLFPRFLKEAPHWRIAVVSGTADSAVPFIGTERWMECLKQPITSDWAAWKMGHDVAGMVKRWAPSLSLVTVSAARSRAAVLAGPQPGTTGSY